ncbi:receptor protein [Salix suchowensis]|nr:receptor protein [Salix suchowensis]
MLCLEDTETTTEEADLLTRSSKKVKIGDITSSSGTKGGNTYIESLMGDSFVEPEEDDDIYNSDCISDDDEEDCDEDDCPVIKLTAEEKKRIRAPWKQTLIIKLMGRRVGYMFLIQRLKYMWKLRGDFTLTDLGNEFYLAKFANTEDRAHVLFEGPWMVADHYLTVRTWHPNFDPFEASIDKVAVWVRLPDLAMEYYDSTVLWKIGDNIGKTLKIDRATSVGSRGKFARLCVEVDLTKPLLAKFKLRRRIRRIMYEGLHLVCFKCGQYGHKQELCPNEIHTEKEEMRSMDVPESPEVPVVRPEVMESFGNWMIVERRPRRPTRGPVTETKPADGKRGSHAEKHGATAETLKEGTINVSTRYDALLKVNENAGFGGADDNGERNEDKETETQMAEKRDLTQEDGRPLGRKKQRASMGSSGLRMDRAAQGSGLKSDQAAQGNGLKVDRAAQGSGLADGGKERRTGFKQPTPKPTMTATSGKGKEKMEENGKQEMRDRKQSMTVVIRKSIHSGNVEPRSTEMNMKRNGASQITRPMESNCRPDPPDEITRMDEENEMIIENERVDGQDMPGEDIRMEEEDGREAVSC